MTKRIMTAMAAAVLAVVTFAPAAGAEEDDGWDWLIEMVDDLGDEYNDLNRKCNGEKPTGINAGDLQTRLTNAANTGVAVSHFVLAGVVDAIVDNPGPMTLDEAKWLWAWAETWADWKRLADYWASAPWGICDPVPKDAETD